MFGNWKRRGRKKGAVVVRSMVIGGVGDFLPNLLAGALGSFHCCHLTILTTTICPSSLLGTAQAKALGRWDPLRRGRVQKLRKKGCLGKSSGRGSQLAAAILAQTPEHNLPGQLGSLSGSGT